MSQRSHLTDSEAWRVVGRLEGGQTQAEVAKAIGVSQSVISRIWNRFLETGSAGRRPGQGRRLATTPNEYIYLVLTARRHRNMNATLLQQHLCSATGTTVSIQIIRNRLYGIGLYARRPMVCVRLTSRHRRDRREWATEHVNWRRNEWSNVLLSDESRFSVHPDNRRIFIWRDRCNPYIIRDCPLTARRYRDEILRPIEVPYAAAIGDDFILMDDNCRPHRANLVEDFLFEEGIFSFRFRFAAPAREDACFAGCHNGQSETAVRSGTYSFSFSFMDTRGESETYKKDKERTIQQIHKDLTYHHFAELDSFSIM
ncbi:transposable element Tcb2 transposase [Trichonephila clavipes]|nr:transposable element Tcb2 transposase [Trichonephila clavipes]